MKLRIIHDSQGTQQRLRMTCHCNVSVVLRGSIPFHRIPNRRISFCGIRKLSKMHLFKI